MNSRLGIAIGARVIRAVRLEGWPRRQTRFAEVEWDGGDPQRVVDALRQHLGPASRLGIALDLPLLFVKQVKLPPLAARDKANVLRLEPERFFPVRAEDLITAARARDDLVFATREAPLTAWVSVLEGLGPIELVEAGPSALTRALADARVTSGTAVLIQGESGIGIVEIDEGRVRGTRRVYGGLADAAGAIETGAGPIFLDPWDEGAADELRRLLSNARIEPIPTRAVPSQFLPAYGAALGAASARANGELLHSTEMEARIHGRRRRDGAIAGVLCAAALVLAFLSADGWRDRTKRRLDSGLGELNLRATPALALQTQLVNRQREAQAIAQIQASRPDPLAVLVALSQRLPRGAYVRNINSSGAEWRFEGLAPNAAQVLGLLDAAPAFHDVHFLSATNRAVVGTRTYESFTLAFRYTPAP